MMDPCNVMELRNISKTYVVKRRSRSGGMRASRKHQVIRDLTLDIRKGEVLGIIGQNGSGKSTLLKIMSGILMPDVGSVECFGEVASILELGAGFDGNFTGRENIYTKCALYGFSDKEIDGFIDDIIAFSGLGEEIDEPLKTYSSGMAAKLALPTILFLRKDVMIFDEILSVGDAGIGAKCNQIFKNLKNEGKTIVLASHNMRTIEKISDRVVWMDDGSIIEVGQPSIICRKYETSLLESVDVVTRGAESGDTSLQNRLGVMYRDGINVEKSSTIAEYWFRKAANLGYVDAMMNLAKLLIDRGDVDEALNLYAEAADSGNVDAYRLSQNIVDKSNSEGNGEIISRLVALSQNGNIQATTILAECYDHGVFTIPDFNKSFEYYSIAADEGQSSALYNVGMMLREGKGVGKDVTAAIQKLEDAANSGYVNAILELARMYRDGLGVEVDPDKSAELYSRAAMAGNTKAMSTVGLMYRDGLGVPKDEAVAEKWLRMYSRQLSLKYIFALAQIEKNNSSNPELFFKWMHRAAEEGFIPAMVETGNALLSGYGTGKDVLSAVVWYERAANNDNPVAMAKLSKIYSDGEVIDPDYQKAFKYGHNAAAQNNPAGLFQLGIMYRDGLGVEVDLAKAKHYFEQSLNAGNKSARKELKNLSL